MTVMKYRGPVSPFAPVDRLASELFGTNISRLFGSDSFANAAPRVNIQDQADKYLLEMEVPGFDKKDLRVEMEGDTLTIRGEHSESSTSEEARYTRREFGHSSFERRFVLPQTADSKSIQAEHVNGVLKLSIPKVVETKPAAQAISIQ